MAKLLQKLENKRQIYVTPEGANGPQVTFDNNADENCWWFHQGKDDPHGTGILALPKNLIKNKCIITKQGGN